MPAERLIEVLGPIDVGDRHDDDFEPHVRRPGGVSDGRRFTEYIGAAHADLHGFGWD